MDSSKVLVLRTDNSEMEKEEGVLWPQSGIVEARDWSPAPSWAGGLHGVLWGVGDGAFVSFIECSMWFVVEVDGDRVVELEFDGIVKFPAGKVVHCGDRASATRYINKIKPGPIVGLVETAGDDEISTVGYRGTAIAGDGGSAMAGYGGTATAGYRGTAVAGDGGAATAGYKGTATAGYGGDAVAEDRGAAIAGDGGTATAGDGGTAMAGNRGTATAGDGGTAMAGYRGTAIAGRNGRAIAKIHGRAAAGDNGIISIVYYDNSDKIRILVGYVGENGLSPDTLYRAEGGELIEV